MKAVFPGQRELVQSDSWARAMEVITVNQAAGVDPTMGLVNSPQSLAANATSATDQINYNYIDPNSIARTTMTGNISSVTIS